MSPVRVSLGLGLLALALTAGCQRRARGVIPTERVLVTKLARAPMLSEPLAGATAEHAATWGEAHLAGERRADFAWTGLFDGRTEQRTGLVELRRRPGDAPRFGFTSDYLEAEVPTSPWLCAELAAPGLPPGACAEGLLRTVATERTLLAWLPGWGASCPIALLHGGSLSRASLPGLAEVRVVAIDARPVVLAFSHWHRGGAHTGKDLVVLGLDPPLERLGQVSLRETDARDPGKVTYWLGSLEILGDGLRIHGRRSVRGAATNAEISGADVDERWGLGQAGKLVKK